METAKSEVQSILNKLPENCSLEDVQYHLYVLEKIKIGLDRSEKEGVISHEDAEKRLKKWIIE